MCSLLSVFSSAVVWLLRPLTFSLTFGVKWRPVFRLCHGKGYRSSPVRLVMVLAVLALLVWRCSVSVAEPEI
jgi:hypothetical protein